MPAMKMFVIMAVVVLPRCVALSQEQTFTASFEVASVRALMEPPAIVHGSAMCESLSPPGQLWTPMRNRSSGVNRLRTWLFNAMNLRRSPPLGSNFERQSSFREVDLNAMRSCHEQRRMSVSPSSSRSVSNSSFV